LIRKDYRWTYALKTNRDDLPLIGLPGNWGVMEAPYELPSEQMRKLKPLVVAELNRRKPKDKLGDQMENILDEGLEASFTRFAPQNFLILLRWLAILMAVVGAGSMFVRPRDVPALPEKIKAFFLGKLIACVRRWRKSGELFIRSRRGPAR
jgi:hypothetical protein